MKVESFRPWLLAARPKTLSAAVVPVAIGTALAAPPVRRDLFSWALAGALFIQIGTNLVNDALDFRKGADTAERLGPTRVTQAGLISAEGVLRAAYVCFGLAAACGIPLLMRGGWPMLVIGLSSIAAAYVYTGGPYPLAYNGLGEVFVLVFFGLVAVGGSYYVQVLRYGPVVALAGIACGSLACALLAINNLRDVASDRKSSKRTMAVRFGEAFGRAEIALFAMIPFVLQVSVSRLAESTAMLLPLAALPVALVLSWKSWRASGRELNGCLALAGVLQWLFGILFVAGTLVR